jgi:hypothetical protein
MSKKYNNKSNFVQQWTTQKLKKEAAGLHGIIYQLETFATHDLLDYEAVVAELERRGYDVSENKTLVIEKA